MPIAAAKAVHRAYTWEWITVLAGMAARARDGDRVSADQDEVRSPSGHFTL
jgi:hypothetical protein